MENNNHTSYLDLEAASEDNSYLQFWADRWKVSVEELQQVIMTIRSTSFVKIENYLLSGNRLNDGQPSFDI